MDLRLDEKKLYYQQVMDIWEGFCRLHKGLYDLACEEYLTLLESDIDKLESMLPLKEDLISKIGELESERADLIEKLNQNNLFENKIVRVGDLINSFTTIEKSNGIQALHNLNDLLIDIIQKIQDQNKKNQIFLNKAMLSLREIKQGFSGKKAFTTYGADGVARAQNK